MNESVTGEWAMSQSKVFPSALVKASDMIGTHVINANHEKLGEIKEVVIDPYGGMVAYAVVSFGGVLSLGEKLFAVPFNAFKYNVKLDKYILDMAREKLETATGFDKAHWPSMADEKWNREVYRHYGQSPYWE
jgi:sporulation protein YlmC with PRC-barrel domain